MSDMVERTLTALPGLFLQNQLGGPAASRAPFFSRLGGLIRGVTALSSKHEEEKLIQQELSSLKATVSAPTTTLKTMKECMVRLIYCEMLGYDASFGYIHAIKLAQQGNLLEKRVGYLAVSLFLHESHELLLLLVNTVVKDLQSTNLVEVCMALTVVSQIFPREMIPAVLPLIEDKLQHSKEIIRRKAVLALYKFYLIAPNQVQHIHTKFRKALCDRDVGVMAASLHIYLRMIKENASGYKDLTESFVTILKQVVGGKLPVEFSYHSVPAPWLQIQLLRILGLLGKDDERTSELMYDVLDESLRRAELNHNVTYGLKALTYVIQQDPSLALQHQITIIECLDHPDPIIKRETMNAVFSVGGDVMHPDILSNFLRLLAEGFDDETEDQQLRLYAVQSYLTLLDMENTFYPQRFLQVMSWVLGEYSYLLDKEGPEEVITRLYKLLMSDSISSETKAWLFAAVTKLTPQAHSSPLVEKLIQEFTVSLNTCLRQHAFELKHLHENTELMKSLLQGAQNCEDIVADASLSFLDGFVAEGLSQGAAPYKPHHQRQEEQLSQEKVLNFEPYGLSFSSSGFTGRQSPAGISLGSDISGNSAETGLKETSSLKMEGIKKLWGKEGYLPKKESGTGDKPEASHVPAEGATVENVDQATTRKDQAQGHIPSTEEKEKQLLASSLFVGLGPENTVDLLGKADVVSHKFRRKSKLKVAQSDKTPSAPTAPCSALSLGSDVAGGDEDGLSAVDRGDGELSSELFRSESLSGPPSAEKLESVSLPVPSLFADNNMEVFNPPSSSATSTVKEETPECRHSGLVEICSNEAVSVSSYKVWRDDCLLVIWAVTSKTDSEFTDAQLEIFPVENFKISTEDFGKLWLSFANDVKQTIKISEPGVALTSVLTELQQNLRLRVIDVIGNEGLLACKLLPSTPCVLHCRVHADAVALWFRSSSSVLSDYLSCHCQKVMQTS
ncbi:mCG133987 [Mus musculus]|nr:mCG133987 [Mus musculus]